MAVRRAGPADLGFHSQALLMGSSGGWQLLVPAAGYLTIQRMDGVCLNLGVGQCLNHPLSVVP